MLKVLTPFVVGLLWLIVSTVFMGFLPSRFPPPDVVLIVVIIFGFWYPLPLGGGLAFLLGLVQDVLSGGFIGLNALSKTVVFSLTRSIARRFYFSNLTSKIAMVFFGGIVDSLLVTGVLLIGGGIHIPGAVFVRQMLLQILCTGFLSPLVFIIAPHVSDLRERGDVDTFRYGKKKARIRGI